MLESFTHPLPEGNCTLTQKPLRSRLSPFAPDFTEDLTAAPGKGASFS
jgi:hypothetical protein